MIIVKMFGGIGNQMFQYAFYKNLSLYRKPILIDDSTYQPSMVTENIKINSIFKNVIYKMADQEKIDLLNDSNMSILNRLRRKYIYKKQSHIRQKKFSFMDYFNCLEGDYYLEGFWQSEKYFYSIRNQIRTSFKFNKFNDHKNRELATKLMKQNSVSIHVRKGEGYNNKIFRGVCETAYYKKSIDCILNIVKNPTFYIFSDNFNWCRENLSFINATAVDWNPGTGPESIRDMHLMSLCRHNIIANSSYSWWGAWLNRNPAKVVIGPKRWFNSDSPKFDTRDILPETWIRV